MTSRILHAGWVGQPQAWHQSTDGRRRPWVEPAVLQVGASVGGGNLHYYRLSHRLTLYEMVAQLGNCVSVEELRACELGRMPLPTELSNWLAL